jgi:hypothetical protein
MRCWRITVELNANAFQPLDRSSLMYNQVFYRHIHDEQERRRAMLRDEALDEGLTIHVFGGGAGGYFVRLQPLGTDARSHSGYLGTAATMADALAAALARARDARGRA